MPFARTRGTRANDSTLEPVIAAGEGHDGPPFSPHAS